MSEQYREYGRTRSKNRHKSKVSLNYSKKLKLQIIFSLIIFSAVYLFKISDTSLSKQFNEHLNSALTYEVDIKPITDFLTNTQLIKIK